MKELTLVIVLCIIVLIIGWTTGYCCAKQMIKSDNKQIMTEYMAHRERMKQTKINITAPHPGKNKLTHTGEKEDLDVDNINHHLGSRGADPESSMFAMWRSDEFNQDVYWQ